MTMLIKHNMSAFEEQHSGQYILIRYIGHHSDTFQIKTIAELLEIKELISSFIELEKVKAQEANNTP
jgi:hypothetical protein